MGFQIEAHSNGLRGPSRLRVDTSLPSALGSNHSRAILVEEGAHVSSMSVQRHPPEDSSSKARRHRPVGMVCFRCAILTCAIWVFLHSIEIWTTNTRQLKTSSQLLIEPVETFETVVAGELRRHHGGDKTVVQPEKLEFDEVGYETILEDENDESYYSPLVEVSGTKEERHNPKMNSVTEHAFTESQFGVVDGFQVTQTELQLNKLQFDPFDPRYSDLEVLYEVPPQFALTGRDEGKFLLYQPSGGWGNQRLVLRWAVLLANAMNRTLVLPPIAPHSNFYKGFNKFESDQVLHMGYVLDLETLNSVVYKGIKVHSGDMSTYQNDILQHLSWREYERNPLVTFINEKKIAEKWKNEEAGVVFWHKTSMWKCCTTSDPHYYIHVADGIQFSPVLIAAALRAMSPKATKYNAIHFRRGDSAMLERRSVQAYMKRHRSQMLHFNKSIPLYIATDEQRLDMFDKFRRFGFSQLLFSTDLDRATLQPLLKGAPRIMHGTIHAIIDQIVCVYAERWSGSAKSTFSYTIASMRNKFSRLIRNRRNNGNTQKFLPRPI